MRRASTASAGPSSANRHCPRRTVTFFYDGDGKAREVEACVSRCAFSLRSAMGPIAKIKDQTVQRQLVSLDGIDRRERRLGFDQTAWPIADPANLVCSTADAIDPTQANRPAAYRRARPHAGPPRQHQSPSEKMAVFGRSISRTSAASPSASAASSSATSTAGQPQKRELRPHCIVKRAAVFAPQVRRAEPGRSTACVFHGVADVGAVIAMTGERS